MFHDRTRQNLTGETRSEHSLMFPDLQPNLNRAIRVERTDNRYAAVGNSLDRRYAQQQRGGRVTKAKSMDFLSTPLRQDANSTNAILARDRLANVSDTAVRNTVNRQRNMGMTPTPRRGSTVNIAGFDVNEVGDVRRGGIDLGNIAALSVAEQSVAAGRLRTPLGRPPRHRIRTGSAAGSAGRGSPALTEGQRIDRLGPRESSPLVQRDSDLTLVDLDDVDVSVIDDEGSLHGPVLSEPTVTLQDSTAGSIPPPASGMDMSFFLLLSMLQQGGRRGGGSSGGGGGRGSKSTLDSYTTSKQNVEHNHDQQRHD